MTGATCIGFFQFYFNRLKQRYLCSVHASIPAKTNSVIHVSKSHREENVFLVLVDGSRIWDCVGVLQYRHALSYTHVDTSLHSTTG